MTEADLRGLRRRDAVLLIAAAVTPEDVRPFGWFRRLYYLRRWGVRKALGRLVERGLVEPGWSVRPLHTWPVRASVTDEGRRVARAAAVTLELEEFAGPA